MYVVIGVISIGVLVVWVALTYLLKLDASLQQSFESLVDALNCSNCGSVFDATSPRARFGKPHWWRVEAASPIKRRFGVVVCGYCGQTSIIDQEGSLLASMSADGNEVHAAGNEA